VLILKIPSPRKEYWPILFGGENMKRGKRTERKMYKKKATRQKIKKNLS
jgi:hypothetical protein